MAILGTLIEQVRGVSYKPEDLHTTLNENSITLLRANNIKDGKLNFDDVIYVDKKKVSEKQLLKSGDILICASSGSKELVGKAAYVECDLLMTFGTFCKVVRPKTECSKYIGHFFNSPYYRERIANSAAGANINNIRNEHIDTLEIIWPSLREQHCAVTVLDRVCELIDLRKEQLAKLDQLIKSRFVELFGDPKLNDKGWTRGVVSNYFEVKGGKRIPKGMGYSERKTNHPYLRATDMKNETIIEDDIHYIDEEVFQHIKRYTVKGGDIYLTNVGVNLGMAGVIPQKFDGASLTENAVKLVPKTENVIDGLFLAHYINTPGIQEYINERKMSVGVPKLAIFRIETMPLLIPPMNFQQEFNTFVEQTDKSKLAIQQSLDKLELLKKSLMQEYFG